mmetsp:Transcript_20160/g.20260  ORF Transcript_20160/g.20260 Transcript_20160/m.20260 type:complete len:553 (+) Transcript_20160:93-1751(+)|eukprot:CAMPEP_0182427514 /NCGR_PEP_ID=MMETSP1167-20130531/18074_1 /TAXON_ID=2988 /ORGANISM="Mallomonas Sp, Strain CCMP3275" /LENGTH=552 /DNA_ID=CAMNT_0024609813 /DNA_START=92 /DNA_END=1750 /DNA_ORIENTATION=+
MRVSLRTAVAASLAALVISFRPIRSSLHSSIRGSSLTMMDEYTFAVVGDLHLDPRYMEDMYAGREHIKKFLVDESGNPLPRSAVLSVGDLGESKSVSPETTKELFAGTTACFNLAREYLDGFGTQFNVVGGNHDLEGIDEFPTDETNLEAYLRILGKKTPQFRIDLAEKVVLLGLGSTLFRSAPFTSHEVVIDDEQIEWFKKTIEECPADDGWKVFVFSHAPPVGSGLRVLQENHVVNGCCWLNHSGKQARTFIDIVRKNPCIKAWFSGHFHLGQDYEDSITFPEGNNRGSCVFAQTAVMARKSSRDGRIQSRLVRGTKTGFTISTIDHKKDGKERLDATITYTDSSHESVVFAHPSEDYDHDAFFSAYTPQENDGCYFDMDADGINVGDKDGVCWWHMSDGRVLGKHNGMVLEYDPSTLAPMGLVVGKDELAGRQLAVVDSGIEVDQEGYEKLPNREQAVVLFDDEGHVTVVQPNEDGSYWRKIVRNKVVRMKEVRRERAAEAFVRKTLGWDKDVKIPIKSTWGPLTSTSGTAKFTGIPGITTKDAAKLKA